MPAADRPGPVEAGAAEPTTHRAAGEAHGFAGIYPMLFALFGADGAMDRPAMRRQVEAMVRNGASGIAVLGLASEGNKLATAERRSLLEWVAEDLGGRLPLAVTVCEASVAEQRAFVRAAAEAGAAWVILQPPPVRGVPESEILRFFGDVADSSPVPVAVQNAPEYLGVGLSAASIKALRAHHPNVSLLKAEAPAVVLAQLIEETGSAFTVFSGRAGLEITDSLRAGCAGVVPGAESIDVLARIHALMRRGDASGEQEAERLYGEILPLLVFLMQSIDSFLVYGKALLCRRLELANAAPRPPSAPATGFGLAVVERFARRLPPL